MIAVFSCSAGLAQQSAFESTNGDTSVFLSAEGGVALANIGKSSVRFGYRHDVTTHPWSYGVDMVANITGTSATLLNNNAQAAGAGIHGSAIRRCLFRACPDASKLTPESPKVEECPHGLCSDWLVFQALYDRAQFNTLENTAPPLQNAVKQNFNGVSGRVAYNQLRKTAHNDFLLGVSLGVGRFNNIDSLKTTNFTDNTITTIGSTEYIASQGGTKTAYVGAYKQYIGVPINADAIWYPGVLGGVVAFDLFARSNIVSTDRYGSPGIGVFLNKKGAPSRPLGGIAVDYRDGKGQVSLVVGWKF
jgi:hypothetical protein